jgi:hypothetical protein
MPLKLILTVMVLTMSHWIADAGAVDLKTLIMPGEVIDGHADVESECENCHVAFSRDQQRPMCEACHEAIADDVKGGLGFHGRDVQASRQECATCHTEHIGRKADVVGLNVKSFDHHLTDFDLTGAHVETACEDCHAVDLKHREAPSLCFDCHAEEDEEAHRGGFGEACESCHVATEWGEVEFDHTEETGYALTGGHRSVECSSCHVEPGYQNTPTECLGCHREDDSHNGLNGSDCAFCHVSAAWTETTFDHAAKTAFVLNGAHGEIACADCHVENKFEQSLETECIACHVDDDEHEGLNGPACETCHTTSVWSKVLFSHDAETEFPLLGGHAEIACAACHTAPVHEVRLETDCYACHRDDDAHEAQLGKACGLCHNATGWTVDVLFDHGLTNFPLIGSHRDAVCTDCHETKRFNDTPGACIDCHRVDDVHERKLGTACQTCHSPADWLLWEFDHNRQTNFELDGAHRVLRCEACHTRPVTGAIDISNSCGGCHRSDDVHGGDFGTDCQRCHTTSDFQSVERVE